ncbi:FliI/YscN family ATPase [bacterium]|nr:FliI/YscN family ATPase [bacterium]
MNLEHRLKGHQPYPVTGRVEQVVGTLIESSGPACCVGDILWVETQLGSRLACEVVGFRDRKALLMPMGAPTGVALGSRVSKGESTLTVDFSPLLMGRILDGLGRPMDGKGPLFSSQPILLETPPPNALQRKPVDRPFLTGVRAIDSGLLLGKGQRVGLFAGSGVGKSTLMGMIARRSSATVNVIALIGERGREVLEFVQQTLGDEGLARSVVVAATSDQSPLVRVKAALVATALAEAFREQGEEVLLLMDSVTRVAMAQREIGLAAGEPPTSRGYTPSVFAMLPKILERSGCSQQGSITAVYTVLVEGDDMNEPIADAVRGILDGHLVLSRSLAHQNHYPALDVLASVSRLMNQLAGPEHRAMARDLRAQLALYHENREMIQLGAYQPGNSPSLDRAVDCKPRIETFLCQEFDDYTTFDETLEQLRQCLS